MVAVDVLSGSEVAQGARYVEIVGPVHRFEDGHGPLQGGLAGGGVPSARQV